MSRTRTLDTPGNVNGTAPEFLVRPEMLDVVSPPGDRGGMVIGKGARGESVTASILRPDGTGSQAYMVYDNFRTTLKWNRSTYFALAVGHLADAMIGH